MRVVEVGRFLPWPQLVDTPRVDGREAIMSKTPWIGLALALSLACHGCVSSGDDDSPEDDDATTGDDDDVDDDDDDVLDDDYTDDDDADFFNHVYTFDPPSIVVGETPPFTATGVFCEGTELSFSDPTSYERVYVQHYTSFEEHQIEGTIPEGLWIGSFDVVADCPYGATGGLPGGLEVVDDYPGDDDDSAGDDDDSAAG